MLICSMSSKNSLTLTGVAKRYVRSACDNPSFAYHLLTMVENWASKFLSAETIAIGTVSVSVVDIDDKDGEDALKAVRYRRANVLAACFRRASGVKHCGESVGF